LVDFHGGINEDVVEAACLAHDLGHPPFGHVAESMLSRLAGSDIEGFEGNAQSFRIVSELAFRSPDYNGLNLTRATLRAILKYPWTYEVRPPDPSDQGKKKNKWGAYRTESAAFRHATGELTGPVPRCAEAEIMDWADDLTYSVHDVEDFYRAGLIPLHSLRPAAKGAPASSERQRFLDYVWYRKDRVEELENLSQQDIDSMFRELIFATFTLDGPYEGTRNQRASLRTFTSNLVDRYINGLKLCDGTKNGVVEKDQQLKAEVALLKQLTWFYVIEAASLATQQHAQKQIIKYLYAVFRNEAKRRPTSLLPPYYRDRLKEIPSGDLREKRVVVDLIAGMTEAQAIAVYHRLNGIVVGSGLDKVLV
jgi:dGTPase